MLYDPSRSPRMRKRVVTVVVVIVPFLTPVSVEAAAPTVSTASPFTYRAAGPNVSGRALARSTTATPGGDRSGLAVGAARTRGSHRCQWVICALLQIGRDPNSRPRRSPSPTEGESWMD